MANDAHVVLFGATVMSEPKTSQTSTNQTWLKLNVAVQTSKKDPNPKNPKYPYLSDYYNVNVYGKYAEGLLGKIKIKTKLDVIGTMYMSEPFTNRDGKTMVTPCITASEVKITGGGNYVNYNNNNQAAQAPVVEQRTEEEEAPF